jgi:hypothetical protein
MLLLFILLLILLLILFLILIFILLLISAGKVTACLARRSKIDGH